MNSDSQVTWNQRKQTYQVEHVENTFALHHVKRGSE